MSTRIDVHAETDYPVLIGTDLSDEVLPLVEGASRAMVVHAPGVDAVVGSVTASLQAAGLHVLTHQLPDGEAAKTATVLTECWDVLGEAAFGRRDVIVGVGGGATTDVAGFVAATWLRGVRMVGVPTTLLGMVDAAVGGKTGINTSAGKNLVGAFSSPAGVLCDLASLRTLPRPDLIAGMAEIIKCGFIADPQILQVIEDSPQEATDPGSDTLADLVHRAIQVKAEVVGADLKESHLREILNYGHTFGHAIERTEGFRWRHGEAVAVGMVYAAELARLAGRLDGSVVDAHRQVLGSLGLPLSYRPGRWAELHDAMRRDKKTRGDMLRFVVLDAIAQPGRLEGPDPELLEAAYAAVSSTGASDRRGRFGS